MNPELINQFNDFWKINSKQDFLNYLKQLNNLFTEGIICNKGNEDSQIDPDFLIAYYGLKKDIAIQDVNLSYQELLKFRFNDIQQVVNEVNETLAKQGALGWVYQTFAFILPDELPEIVKTANSLLTKIFQIINNVVEAVENITEGLAQTFTLLPLIILAGIFFFIYLMSKRI